MTNTAPPDRYRTPKVGDDVHYVSFGTPPRPDGTQEYTSRCRAATVTEVGQWVTKSTVLATSYARSEGRAIRTVEQWFYEDAAAVVVLNPTGLFFNGAAGVACQHDEGAEPAGGTWHWPEP